MQEAAPAALPGLAADQAPEGWDSEMPAAAAADSADLAVWAAGADRMVVSHTEI